MKNRYQWIILVGMCIMCLTSLSYGETTETPKPHHYYDLQDNSLEQYDVIWEHLSPYYGEFLPDLIRVRYIGGGISQFNTYTNQILLGVDAAQSPFGTLAHETSHLALHRLTEGASTLEAFRFLDEGWAKIMEASVTNSLKGYKKLALQAAAIQHRLNPLSVEKVQDWSEYFGTSPKTANWRSWVNSVDA